MGVKKKNIITKTVDELVGEGLSSIFYAFNSIVRGRIKANGLAGVHFTKTNRPILLVPGYFSNRGSLYLMEKFLKAYGFTVFSIRDLTLNLKSIKKSAFDLHQKIERLQDKYGFPKIDIVGHSEGGLIALYYILKLGGDKKVKSLITLGTPYHGTWLALCGIYTFGLISRSAWQMVPGASFIKKIKRAEAPSWVNFYSIAARLDPACPPKRARIPFGENIIVHGAHLSLICRKKTFAVIVKILNDEFIPTNQFETAT